MTRDNVRLDDLIVQLAGGDSRIYIPTYIVAARDAGRDDAEPTASRVDLNFRLRKQGPPSLYVTRVL